MGTIMLNTNGNWPDFCFEVLEVKDGKPTGRSIFCRTDWDYPGFADSFGWDMTEVQTPQNMIDGTPCDHSGTDGTVPCPVCGLMPATFMAAALDYIQDHDGAEAEDPGYFNEEDSR